MTLFTTCCIGTKIALILESDLAPAYGDTTLKPQGPTAQAETPDPSERGQRSAAVGEAPAAALTCACVGAAGPTDPSRRPLQNGARLWAKPQPQPRTSGGLVRAFRPRCAWSYGHSRAPVLNVPNGPNGANGARVCAQHHPQHSA